MAWKKPKQLKAAAIATREAGLVGDQRDTVLLSLFGKRCLRQGRPSTRAPALTNADFEAYMALMEHRCGGKLNYYARGHFRRKADDALSRMRYKARAIARELEAAGLLHPDGGLGGFVERQTAHREIGSTRDLEHCDYHDLVSIIEGLKGWARGRGVRLEHAGAKA